MAGVVMLVNEFAPLPVGGAERQAERLSAYLSGRGWPVWVLTRGVPGLPASETVHGFTIIRPRAWGPGKLGTVSFVFGALFELVRRRKDYSILHAHLAFGAAFAAVLAARLLGKRVLVKLGNSGEFGDIRVSQKSWRGRLRLAAFRKWADTVIVLDEVMQAEALDAGFAPQQVRRINNGIDARMFSDAQMPADAKAALGLNGKVVVLSVGRLAAQKSLPVLFESFAKALPGFSELRLLLVGDGPERTALEALADSLKIKGQVTFAGNQADVRPYLQAADIFALPSASEGISNALLEAMSAGLACLATPVGGNPEVLKQGDSGMLLPMDDIETWSSALVTLGHSAKLRAQMGTAARERVRAEYDFSVVGARYEALYAELSGSSHSRLKAGLDKRLHILHLIDGLNVGGAEVLLRDLSAGLTQRGYRVSVAYSTPGPLVDELAGAGLQLTRLPRMGRIDPFLFWGMLNLMRSDPPQVVHTHLFKSDFHGRLVARSIGVPVVVSTLHNTDAWARHWPLGKLYGATARFADKLIAVSEDVRAFHLKYTGVPAEKVTVIENAVDVRKFTGKQAAGDAVRAEFGIDPEVILFGIIGRLQPQKDHATFFNAAVQILRQVPSARFFVVGAGALQPELEKMAAELGLLPALIFCGLRSDIPAILAALDVLVFSSRWEGLPVTLLEGMAAGKAVVATAVDGIRGVVVVEETALLVPAGDPAALAGACCRLAGDEALRKRLGQAGFERVSAHFSLDAMIDQTANLYNNLLSAHGLGENGPVGSGAAL